MKLSTALIFLVVLLRVIKGLRIFCESRVKVKNGSCEAYIFLNPDLA